jgi:hypothetical protein
VSEPGTGWQLSLAVWPCAPAARVRVGTPGTPGAEPNSESGESESDSESEPEHYERREPEVVGGYGHITIGFIQWKSSLSYFSVLGSYSNQTRLLTAMLPLTVRPSGGPY